MQEGNLWRKLHSKDVVKLLGIGAEDMTTIATVRKSFFIVCEYLHGPTLREIVQQQMFSTKKDKYRTRDVLRYASVAPSPTVIFQYMVRLHHVLNEYESKNCGAGGS
jgi:hypothetical protein